MYKFINSGIQNCGKTYQLSHCKRLLKTIYQTRNFKKIFLTQKEFDSTNQSYFGTNPKPGRNLLHKLDCSFIFDNKKFISEMKKTLGNNFRILDYKLVMGVPNTIIPKWIIKRTLNQHTINLGAFIKPRYRDITYFRGIDFHQDIIDFPTRDADFITAYIYLEDVNENTSPLYLIPNSHKLGATQFPHKLKFLNKKTVNYQNNKDEIKSNIFMLSGKAGSLSYWHPFTLHGTKPHELSIPRISIRILAEKNRRINVNCNLDKINKKINGKKILAITQNEFSKKGKVKNKGNKINKL